MCNTNQCAEAPRFIKNFPSQQHETVTDPATGLTWQASVFPDSYTFDECAKVARECRIGGFTDWRVPTRVEALTLVDDTRYNPAIDTDYFPGTPSQSFWTATTYAGDPSTYAWLVGFYDGDSDIYYRNCRRRLRLVRGPSRQ